MISIKGLTKEFKKYNAPNSLKGLLLHWRQHKKNLDSIPMLRAVNNLTLDINESEVLCITGPNGAGKSTLAKLIAGTIQPTRGSIDIKGRVVPFLELGVAFNQELTGLDNLYLNGVLLGLSLSFLKKNKDKIFAFAGVGEFASTPLKYYSSGMQLRLAFSIAMHAHGDVYIFDEILVVGDTAFEKKCLESFAHLVEKKKTIIIISHDIEFIQKHATQLLVLTQSAHYLVDDLKKINHVEDIDELIAFCADPINSIRKC